MKILVVSLLRLGDIVMTTSVLQALKEAHPKSQIDYLINSEFSHVVPLLPNVNRVHLFDRSRLQNGLAHSGRSVFEPFDRLNSLIDGINQEQYDLVLNLTHNRMSAWIMALIEAKEKRGIEIRPNGTVSFGSPWFKYLNDYLTSSRTDVFHFMDVFAHASGVARPNRKASINLTAAGQKEANQILEGFGRFVAVQPLTNDEKKNWGLERFQQTMQLIAKLNPDFAFIVLGAPSERKILEKLVQDLATSGVSAKLAICSLEGAASILARADIVLTGDTAIKHLAAAVSSKVVELSIGSSSFNRTGIYAEGNVIIQSAEGCAPCSHRRACPYDTHRCAIRLSPELVALVVHNSLMGRWDQLRTIATEFQDEAEVLMTSFNEAGDWCAVPLAKSMDLPTILPWIDRSSWKLLLDGAIKEKFPPIGSEALNLARTLKMEFPEEVPQGWREVLGRAEKQLETLDRGFGSIVHEMKTVLKKIEDPKNLSDFYLRLSSFGKNIGHSAVGVSYSVVIEKLLEPDSGPTFLRARRVREMLSDMHIRSQFELKLVRSLKQQMVEII